MQCVKCTLLTQQHIVFSQHCLFAPSQSFLVTTPMHHGRRFATRGPSCAAGISAKAEAAAVRPKRGNRGPAEPAEIHKVLKVELSVLLAYCSVPTGSCTPYNCVKTLRNSASHNSRRARPPQRTVLRTRREGSGVTNAPPAPAERRAAGRAAPARGTACWRAWCVVTVLCLSSCAYTQPSATQPASSSRGPCTERGGAGAEDECAPRYCHGRPCRRGGDCQARWRARRSRCAPAGTAPGGRAAVRQSLKP